MREIDYDRMLPLYGKWEIDEATGNAVYQDEAGDESSHGLVLLGKAVDDGIIEATIKLPEPNDSCGAFIVFRAEGQQSYFAAGLGGWDNAYTLIEGHHLTPTRLASSGNINNLQSNRQYNLKIALDGQRVQVFVDDVKVIDYKRLPSSSGTGLGLFAFRGSKSAIFGKLKVDDSRPNAFIAMQFSEPYNEVYRDAIEPIISEIGFEPIRVDDISSPGLILNDIWKQITESSVVISEISEKNPNVYYELGAAHALGKPTILLATKGTSLPFDVGPHRCIFYENTIPGRAKLQDALRASLGAALGLTSAE